MEGLGERRALSRQWHVESELMHAKLMPTFLIPHGKRKKIRGFSGSVILKICVGEESSFFTSP